MKKLFVPLAVMLGFFLLYSCIKPRKDNIDYFNAHINKTVDSTQDLLINEMCMHAPLYLDSDYAHLAPPDDTPQALHWVELYNPTDSTIAFHGNGYYMSNDSNNKPMYLLDSFSIPAKGYFIVITDSASPPNIPIGPNITHLHATFKDGKGGGFIGLYKHSDQGWVTLTQHTYAAVGKNVSEGRYPDAGTVWYNFNAPTPLAPNSTNGGATLAVNQ